MPVTRGRAAAAAAAAAVTVEEESDAAIDISSDSDAESAESASSSEDEPSGDEDYIDVSDGGEIYVDISDSDGEEGGCEGNEGGAEAGQPGADRSDAACTKIADLLRRGRNLDRVKLVECKAYLKKNGLSQVGDMTTCVERIMLHWRCHGDGLSVGSLGRWGNRGGCALSSSAHGEQATNVKNQQERAKPRTSNEHHDVPCFGALLWRFSEEDPEKIYPRSSFCINCKGDVCRGDAVLFKQKVHEKSGKRHSKCIGKRIVAGKVIKESYGKEKQQHTFTIQVFWSKGVGKLQPLYMHLVKGRNLYRMMTLRQPWPNEADRSKALEEKHNRGDAARRVRALNRPNSRGHVLNGKKSMEEGKHLSQPGGPDGGSRRTKGKKRIMQSSNSDLPTKKSRKEEHQVSSAAVCNGLNSTKVKMSKRKAGSKQHKTVGSNHAQLEGRRVSSASHSQTHHGNSVGINQPLFGRPQRPPPVGINQPLFERPQRPPPLREVGNAWQPCIEGRSIACPNPTMAFEHPNAALSGWRVPLFSQPGVVFPPFNMWQTIYRPHPQGANVMPQQRYSGGSNWFPR